MRWGSILNIIYVGCFDSTANKTDMESRNMAITLSNWKLYKTFVVEGVAIAAFLPMRGFRTFPGFGIFLFSIQLLIIVSVSEPSAPFSISTASSQKSASAVDCTPVGWVEDVGWFDDIGWEDC